MYNILFVVLLEKYVTCSGILPVLHMYNDCTLILYTEDVLQFIHNSSLTLWLTIFIVSYFFQQLESHLWGLNRVVAMKDLEGVLARLAISLEFSEPHKYMGMILVWSLSKYINMCTQIVIRYFQESLKRSRFFKHVCSCFANDVIYYLALHKEEGSGP